MATVIWEARYLFAVYAAVVTVGLALIVTGDRLLTPPPPASYAAPDRWAECEADRLRSQLWARESELREERRLHTLTRAKLHTWEVFGVLLPRGAGVTEVPPEDMIPPQQLPTLPE